MIRNRLKNNYFALRQGRACFENEKISGLCLLSCLAVAFLFCSHAVALGTNANFEPDPAAVKAAEEAQTVKTKEDIDKKPEVSPKSDTVEKVKMPPEKRKPSDTQKPKEAINGGGLPPNSGKPQTSEEPADDYIRGY